MLKTWIATFLLTIGLVGQAAKAPTAAAVTAPGRSLDRALRAVLTPPGLDSRAPRTVLLLLDPSPALHQAGFVGHLAGTLARGSKVLAATTLGMAVVGRRWSVRYYEQEDFGAFTAAVGRELTGCRSDMRNLYAPARKAAAVLGAREGERVLLLVSLENGDAEDDLEGTATALARAKVLLHAITGEALLADSWWQSASRQGLRKCRMRGGDGPFVDLPWGWLFQYGQVNDYTPSGFGVYGLSRLAYVSGGAVHLFTPPTKSSHVCTVYGICPFCNGDHLPEGAGFVQGTVEHFAPWVLSREEAYRAAAADPWCKALLRAWHQAARIGIIRSKPGLQSFGSGYKESRNVTGRWGLGMRGLRFAHMAVKARKLVRETDRIIATLADDLERAAKVKDTLPRFRGMAEFTLMLLKITRVNLIGFAAWCREAAPEIAEGQRNGLEPPEQPLVPPGRTPEGFYWTNLSLCHGLEPFQELRLPGGQAFKLELAALAGDLRAFLDRYAGSQFGTAMRFSGIARFHLTYRGRYVRPERHRRGSSTQEDPTTEKGTARPTRPTRPGTRPGTGPTTGGGR